MLLRADLPQRSFAVLRWRTLYGSQYSVPGPDAVLPSSRKVLLGFAGQRDFDRSLAGWGGEEAGRDSTSDSA